MHWSYISFALNNQNDDTTELTSSDEVCGILISKSDSLQWRHKDRDGISNHQRLDCFLHHLLRHRSKKTSKLCVTGPCEGNVLVTSEFPSQRASNVEKVSIWWCHHVKFYLCSCAVCSIIWYWTNNRQPMAHLRGWDMGCLLWLLIHWGQDKMAAIFQTTFSNTLSRIKSSKSH